MSFATPRELQDRIDALLDEGLTTAAILALLEGDARRSGATSSGEGVGQPARASELAVDTPAAGLSPDSPAEIRPGTIAVVSADDLARYHAFTFSLANLMIPEGSSMISCRGPSVVDNLNGAAATMSPESDWLWVMGDDHEFEPDVLARLLTRMYDEHLDIVVPLCLMRAFPFLPVAYGVREQEGFVPLDLNAVKDQGPLIEVAAAGNAGMLIHRRVIAAMGDPLFKLGAIDTGQEEITTGLAEDLRFCEDAQSYGFKVWLDMSTRIGHVTSVVVWPAYHDDEIGVKLAFGKQETMWVPRDMLGTSTGARSAG